MQEQMFSHRPWVIGSKKTQRRSKKKICPQEKHIPLVEKFPWSPNICEWFFWYLFDSTHKQRNGFWNNIWMISLKARVLYQGSDINKRLYDTEATADCPPPFGIEIYMGRGVSSLFLYMYLSKRKIKLCKLSFMISNLYIKTIIRSKIIRISHKSTIILFCLLKTTKSSGCRLSFVYQQDTLSSVIMSQRCYGSSVLGSAHCFSDCEMLSRIPKFELISISIDIPGKVYVLLNCQPMYSL